MKRSLPERIHNPSGRELWLRAGVLVHEDVLGSAVRLVPAEAASASPEWKRAEEDMSAGG